MPAKSPHAAAVPPALLPTATAVPPALRPTATALALALLLVATACGPEAAAPEPPVMRPVQHFASRREPGPEPPSRIDEGTLLDDTRPLLQPLRLVDLRVRRAPVGRDGVLRLLSPLPRGYERLSRLVGWLKASDGTNSHVVARELFTLDAGREGRSLALELELPPEMRAARRVHLAIHGVGIPRAPRSRFETRAVPIPEAARLEFGIGVLEPDFADGPVSFELSACVEGDCDTLFSGTRNPARPEQRGWRDERLALDALAGQRVRFRFETARAEGSHSSLPAWSNPTVYAPASPEPAGPNVILLSIDTLRADHLGSYGYVHDTAPVVDERFAAQGTLFEHAIAASAVTAPSHMTLFTGLQPSAHGVTSGQSTLSTAIATLPELLRARGISTAAFTEDGYVGVFQGFARGFDRFVENKSAEIGVPEGQVDVTFGQARRWLERNADKRFFLFVHTYQVHSPYAPPGRYADLFRPDAGAPEGTGGPSGRRHLEMMADYDREIRYVDDELRGLLETLERLDLDRRTVFILTSDHGEEFLDHGLVFHGGHLYEESVRVPLLVRGPGVPAGRRIERPVAQADLMPTILDLFGMAPPPGRDARSLLPLLRGEVDAEPSRPIFSESLVGFQAGLPGGRRFDPPGFAVRLGSRKLVRTTSDGVTQQELYDLAADPREARDLLAAGAGDADDLEALLDRYAVEQPAEHRRLAGGAPARAAAPDLDPERTEKLRALGYVE